MKRQFKRLVIIVAGTYVGVCVIIALLQSRLIYFPTRTYSMVPGDVGLKFEELTLTTRDGVSIAAWHVPHPKAMGTVIFCHGNAGNISDRVHGIKLLNEMGVHVLIFDYRGYGRSGGRPSEVGTYEDAEAAWRYLVETRRISPDKIAWFGESLGGAVAIELARRHRPAALVVESTFTSLADIGQLHYPLLPVRWLLKFRYESIRKIAGITCPKLFIHGQADTIVPLSNARVLFDAATEPKQFLVTPGDHNESGFACAPQFTRRLRAFFEEVFAKR